MLSDTETEHLLQLDIKEEPRLSPKSQWRISFTRKRGVTRGTETVYPSGAPKFTPILVGFVFLNLEFSV
jgi:hypothetical protein